MKLLATIDSVELIRKVQRPDGTWGNVYGVTLVSGDDKILAECWKSDEAQKKAGIVPNAIGTAFLEFTVNRGTSKAGNPYVVGNTKLIRFDLANQNIRTDAPATEQKPQEVDLTQVPGQPVEGAQPAEQPQEAKTEGTNLPF